MKLTLTGSDGKVIMEQEVTPKDDYEAMVLASRSIFIALLTRHRLEYDETHPVLPGD